MTNAGLQLQSAMEYLMTYGWSILIIAVVLAAMFELGVFGGAVAGPRAPPDSCRVFRPGGVGSTTNINLEGTCNNELPEYAAQFNGASSYVNVGNSLSLSPTNAQSITAWFNIVSSSSQGMILGLTGSHNTVSAYGTPQEIQTYWTTSGTPLGQSLTITPTGFNTNGWNFIVMTYSSTTGNAILYLNGVYQSYMYFGGTVTVPNSFPVTIGARNGGTNLNFNGIIANVQIYNTTISANDVQYLYQEGIGGTPILSDGIVGWWPLNGDTNDYSGEYSNGVPTNVIFTTAWTNGYTTP